MNSEQMRENGFGIEAEIMQSLEAVEGELNIALESTNTWSQIWAGRAFHAKRTADKHLKKTASENLTEVLRLLNRIETMKKKVKEARQLCEYTAQQCSAK